MRRIVGLVAACAMAAGTLVGVVSPAQATGISVMYNYTATPSISPSSLDFGTVSPGTILSFSVTVTNSTASTMNFPNFGAGITIANDACSSPTIPAGNSCTFDIRWTPTGNGLTSIILVDTANTGSSSGRTISLSATVSSGGGGGGGAPAYFTEPPVTGLALSNDGQSILITPTSSRPIVFCPVTATTLSMCVAVQMNDPNRYNYVYLPNSPVSSLALSTQLMMPNMGTGAVADGTYNVFADNSSPSSGAGIPGYGPLTITVASGTASSNGIAPSAPAVAVFPAINATGQPLLSGAVTGSTAKCVAPEFDVTPTAVDMVLSLDGVQFKSTSLTKAPFETSAAVPAASTGKTVTCSITARSSGGSLTIASDAVVTATAVKPVTPTTPTTPITTCSGTRVIGFGNAATSLSASGAAAASSFGSAACKYTVTGYSQPSSSRASALAAARARAVAAAIKAANPNAVVTVVNGGKAKSASCAKVSNRCVVVSRG